MIRLLILFVNREMRDRYPAKWVLLTEFFTISMSLIIYWYTSKSFAPTLQTELIKSGETYFTFLLIGEWTLLLPIILFEGLSRTVRDLVNNGVLEALQAMPVRPQTPILLLALGKIPSEFVRWSFYLIVAISITSPHLDLSLWARILFLQLIAMPIFIGMGLLAAAMILTLGRGTAFFGHLSTLAAVLAGAYFPTTVFPESVRTILNLISPFNVLLEATRSFFLHQDWSPKAFAATVVLALWSLVVFPLGYWSLGVCFENVRKKGMPILS